MQAVKNTSDNVLTSLPAEEADRFQQFLDGHDFPSNTRRAFVQDFRKFGSWFTQANAEPFSVARITTRDISDFKDNLRRVQGKAIATVNRCLVTLRRYLGWLADKGILPANPAKKVRNYVASNLPQKAW